MFNGIIFNKGRVEKIIKYKKGLNLFVKSSLKLKKKDLGTSISCDGVCLTLSSVKKNIQGFRKIEAGPANKPYDRFCVAPGHQLGFNELKAIEISNFIKSINNEIPEPFNFASGHRIQKLVDAIHKSSKEKRWVMI